MTVFKPPRIPRAKWRILGLMDTEVEYQETRKEIAELRDYLLTNPRLSGKTFISLKWEADNEIEEFANKQSIWDSVTNWIQA